MTRILITGGAGFIGSNLIQSLHKQGHSITVLDTLSEQVHSTAPESSVLYQSIKDKVRFVRGSVSNKEDLMQVLPDQDVIVHFAAETGTGQSMYQIDHYVSANIGATGLILDLLSNIKHDVKRMVVASSRAIYGEGKYLDSDGTAIYPSHRPEADLQSGFFEVRDPATGEELSLAATDEDSKIHPTSVYGITKQVQEQLTMTVCPTIGIQPVALRYQNVYGPGQSLINPYTGILSIFSNLIMNDKPINVFEDGLESRDFVYIDDVVAATELAIFHPDAGQKVLNVGSGEATTVNTVTRKLIECFAHEVSVTVSGNYRLGDIRHNFADLSHISSVLGFKPKVSFEQGIASFVEWAKTLGPKESRYEQSLSEMKARGLMK